MSDHSADLIFFNKLNIDWTSRTLPNTPTLYVPKHLIFTSPPSPSPRSERHMSITPNSIKGAKID